MKGNPLPFVFFVVALFVFGTYVEAQQMTIVRGTGVSGLTVSAPITSSGGSVPNIGCTTAAASTAGCVSATTQTFSGAKTIDTSVTSPSFVSSSAATGYLSNTTSGNNAFGVAVSGARIDFGAGASDHASSNGTTVTFAGPVTATTTLTTTSALQVGTTLTFSATLPTVTSACTSPTITNGKAVSFQVDVGTSCTGVTTIVLGLPTATAGWECNGYNKTTNTVHLQQSADTTASATIINKADSNGAATDFVDGADLVISCTAR